MTEQYRKIAELLEPDAPQDSLLSIVRGIMNTNMMEMGAVAAAVVAGDSPDKRNDKLRKLRIAMGRICEEKQIQKMTVKERGITYVVRPSVPHNDPRRLGKLSDLVQKITTEAKLLGPKERQQIIQELHNAIKALEPKK